MGCRGLLTCSPFCCRAPGKLSPTDLHWFCLHLPEDGDADVVDNVIKALSACPDDHAVALAIPWKGFLECWEVAKITGRK